MAEALRVPMVTIITQRGGMSTSTVIYSQEEVRLTCFGGNSEGFRIVYSTSNLQELYDYTLKAFQVAWKYRWPTFILADGYQGKMMGEVKIGDNFPAKRDLASPEKPILTKGVNLRNCYNLEEKIGEIIVNYSDEYNEKRQEIEEYEEYQVDKAKIILLAHGIVAAATKVAVDELRKKGLSVGLFRPITLRPFPTQAASNLLTQAEKIIVIESAIGQLAELFKAELFGLNTTLIEVNKPALGFTPEEIVKTIMSIQ
jgi:2-oxoglutarate ferredoxin oxidoreductase subunit alpha